jgi:1-acyl-sn-glycerol-3-phosphate acyltransferase
LKFWGWELPKPGFANWFLNALVRAYTRATCRLDISELEGVPQTGPLIVYSNHTGQLEVPMLFAHLQPRKVIGFAKVETWNNWILKWVFDIWGAIPLRRGEADTRAIRAALGALEQGNIIGIAPEGTRNKTGRLLKAHPGIVMLAIRSGAPLIPVAHWGGENFLSNLKRFRRTDFHIRVGEPFRLKTEDLRMTRQIRQEIVDQMMYRLAGLLPEEYRGAYADLENATGAYLDYN